MKLYGSYTSPYVRHCRVAFLQGNLDFDFIEADYATSEKESPTSKVPYLRDGDLMLSESSSIVKHVRQKSGRQFLEDVQDYELFAMSSTLLDTAINMFLLEMEGFGPDQIKYLGRHKSRIESGLVELNQRLSSDANLDSDGELRAACFLGWAQFRNRVNLDDLPNLQAFVNASNENELFASTAPPA